MPLASEREISSALEHADGDVDEAAQSLLGRRNFIPYFYNHNVTCTITFLSFIYVNQGINDVVESSGTTSPLDTAGIDICPEQALRKFCQSSVDMESTRQLFRVNRVDGVADLRRGIMGIYKNPDTNLRACPRIVFEDGVGNGPLREFLQCVMKTVDEGLCGGRGKPVLSFEGQHDHRLPIHDQALRLTGSFKAIGRIIGHCIIHGGPGLYGISNAVTDYWAKGDSGDPPHIVLEDISDIDLRVMISEVMYFESFNE